MSSIGPLNMYIGLLPVLLLLWGSLLLIFGMYKSSREWDIPENLFIILKTATLGFALFGGFAYTAKVQDISRMFALLVFSLATVFISIEKVTLILFFRHIRRKGYNFRNLLIVGTNKRAQRFIDAVTKHTEWGFRIVGIVDKDIAKTGNVVGGYEVIGSLKDIPSIIHDTVVDEVVFVVPRSWLCAIEETIQLCEVEGLKASVAVDHFELKFAKTKTVFRAGFPLVTFDCTSDKIWQLLVKRLFDIVLSGIALISLAPIVAIIAIIIRITSKGPVYFKQERCSMYGRRFSLYKFRTMIKDAEAKLYKLLGNNEMSGPVFKIKEDPRITKVGKYLRKFSLDEFPQFWNVFKGDMSLVGPRPPIPAEVTNYQNWQRRRLSMRPGITCLWQVNGRNTITDFDEWTRLDLEYIDNWSLWLDFKILLTTVPVVLLGKGAK